VDNPKNLDVKGVKKDEIYSIFPDCEIFLKHVTLAPHFSKTCSFFYYSMPDFGKNSFSLYSLSWCN